MKKIAAILLMGILCFNWCGYRLFTAYQEAKADRQLEARLDLNNYDDSQLISIKVPTTHLSYFNTSSQFERVDGQINIKGVAYKYVKRRISNDFVELLCIPNQGVMQIRMAKNEFFKLTNDLQQNGQNKSSDPHQGISKSPVTEYYATNDLFSIGGHFSASPALPGTIYQAASLHSSYAFTLEQPPDALFSLA